MTHAITGLLGTSRAWSVVVDRGSPYDLFLIPTLLYPTRLGGQHMGLSDGGGRTFTGRWLRKAPSSGAPRASSGNCLGSNFRSICF
ncbi:hypothetical protein F4802DRAFT_559128 [Xylaria palmicola]|nr:hypothetical protein F4802DRAFT_559128 [Xylaria palmicola]